MDIETETGNTVFTPGQLICRMNEEYSAGEGVFVENSGIYAGCIGRASISVGEDGRKVVSIKSKKPRSNATSVKIGDTVLARVTKIKDETVFVAILSINDLPTTNKFDGVVKKRDIREKEVDKVQLDKCFIPGDIVKAKVCSYGDSRKIQLSTVEDELGVIFACCEKTGNFMVAISDEEMMCPISHIKEKRKAALVK